MSDGDGATLKNVEVQQPVADPGRVSTLSPPKEGSVTSLTADQWKEVSNQRKFMMEAVTKIFGYLNGGVFGFVVFAYCVGAIWPDRKLITDVQVNALIAATVAQAGLAFVIIARYFFPSKVEGEQK